MGTVFTIDIRDPGEWVDEIRAVVSWLHRVDGTFSTFRDDSDISRLRQGALRLADADPQVAEVLELCADAQRATRGYFTPLLHGRLDPTGLVKGWAIEKASRLLQERGSANHAVNGGGDMQLAGEAAPDRPWTVGISDPTGGSLLLGTVSGCDIAVATSGVAERGRHIVDPFTGRTATGLAGVTVVGPCLTEVDAYATAAFAMGTDAVDWIEELDGYDALLVTADGNTLGTSGWPS